MGRSRSRRPAPDLDASISDTARPAAPSLASATLPRVWQGIGYRPLPDATAAGPLFDFAAVPWPPTPPVAAWGAFAAGARGERLVGVVVVEQNRREALLHGPVVSTDAGLDDPLEVAAQLVAAVLDHTAALGAQTVFARPQGLDRVWVRFGFIPVPEVTLPAPLTARAGLGLYAWRGGSALWSFHRGGSDTAPTPPSLGSAPADPWRSSAT